MKNGIMTRVRRFLAGTLTELGKCTWPDRGNLFESTLLVLLMIAVFAVFVAVIDFVGQGFIRFLTTF